jgi:hypothetical protein
LEAHESLKKTNVSSEVLILPNKLSKNAKNTYPWKHEKDECFERGLDFGAKRWSGHPTSGSRGGPFWGPFWAHFSAFLRAFFGPIFEAILGAFWSHFGAHFGARSAQRTGKTSQRVPSRASKSKEAAFSKTLKNLQFFKVFEVQRLPKRLS